MNNPIDPEPSEIYVDAAGCEWTVIGVHTQPSVILEDAHGFRVVPAIDSPLFRNMRAKASAPVVLRCEPPETATERRIAALEANSHAPVDMDVLIRQHLIVNGVIRVTKHERDAATKELGPINDVAAPDIRVEPTFLDLANFRDIWVRDNGDHLEYTQYLRDALSRFSPTVSPEPKAPGISGAKMAEMAFEMVCGVPAAKLRSPTQTSITDEEIEHQALVSGALLCHSQASAPHFKFGYGNLEHFTSAILAQHSNPISGETPTIESVRELVEKMPRGTIWKTQLDELVEYTKAAVVRFGVGR